MKFPGFFKNMLLIWFIFNFIPIKLNAAELTVKYDRQVLLFAIKDYYYIADSDFVYISNDEHNWIRKDNPFKGIDIEKLSFIAGNDFGYVFHSSGGDVFQIKDTTFTQILKSKYELRSHYLSSPFLIGKELNIFGGYGLFEFRNDIIYFDQKKREWEKKIPTNSESNLPSRRFNHFASADSSDLYIAGGICINPDNEASYLNTENANDVWKYNFHDNKWLRLGKLTNIIDLDKYFYISHNDEVLLLYNIMDSNRNYDLIFVNLKENRKISYKHKNIGILSDVKKGIRPRITFNPYTEKYLLLIDKEDGYSSPIFVSDEDLLGEKIYEGKAYTPDLIYRNLIWVILTIILITILLFYLNKRHKKRIAGLFDKLESIKPHLVKTLSIEEYNVFETIISMHPKPVTYPSLLNHFANVNSYEAQIKKLRTSIININLVLQKELNLNNSVLMQQKNAYDKRIKEIIINPNLYNKHELNDSKRNLSTKE